MRRTESARTLLVVLLGLFALAGCNSHASFLNDQDQCGNGRLDEQEPCDFDEENGGVRFRDGSSCAENGFAGGTPGCADCRVVFDSCVPRQECYPLSTDECDQQACYFYPESNYTGCADRGGLPLGATCGASHECQELAVCVAHGELGLVCSQLCELGSGCPGGAVCTDAGFTEPWGYCPPPELECDPITNNGCMGPEACYFFQDFDPQVQCSQRSGSDANEGVGCDSSEQCHPALTCHIGTCRRLCNLDAECAPGVVCEDSGLGLPDFGLCPFGFGCDPVTNQGCLSDQGCYFTGTYDGFRYCSSHQNHLAGETCEISDDCAPGLMCSTLQNFETRVCHSLCSGRKTCYEGMACALGTDDFLPGLCVVPSTCNPLDPLDPGICSTPYACTVLNDQGMLGCVTPGSTLEGEACNLFNGCEPGFFCDNAGSGTRTCRRLCDLQAPDCPFGNCESMPWGLARVGVCK